MFTQDEREILLDRLEGFCGTLENVQLPDKALARILCALYHYSNRDYAKQLGPLAEKIYQISGYQPLFNNSYTFF